MGPGQNWEAFFIVLIRYKCQTNIYNQTQKYVSCMRRKSLAFLLVDIETSLFPSDVHLKGVLSWTKMVVVFTHAESLYIYALLCAAHFFYTWC